MGATAVRLPRLGLRQRATVAFGAVTLTLSLIMAAAMWFGVSGHLLDQRQRLSTDQAFDNAVHVQRGLGTQGISVPEVLAQLVRSTGSSSLLQVEGRWFATSLEIGPDGLPMGLRELVVDGQPASQRIRLDGRLHLVLGVPLVGSAAYFEIFPLDELDRTYRALSAALICAVLLGPVLGLLVGGWAGRRALRPLSEVALAAQAVAEGNLAARLDAKGDPDLVPIAASFNDTAAALERRVRRDARFASDVSHELRSPLTTMLGAIALFEAHQSALPAEAAEALGLLREEVTRFERLVTDLLEVSRADAGGAQLALEELSLADLVARALPPALRPLLTLSPGAEHAVVLGDKRRLERVVANLVENAAKHAGGVVEIRVGAEADSVYCIVDDAGRGVPLEERHQVFERFARGQGRGRDSSEGSGLGLALVTQHIHLLRGTVHVEDRPGGGARFVVTLPRADVAGTTSSRHHPDEPRDETVTMTGLVPSEHERLDATGRG